MDSRRLFQVLVIGGAVLGLGCVEDASPPEDDAGSEAIGDDAGPAEEADAGSTEPMECGFCPNDVCCETDASGQSVTRPGMLCCWGTSC